MMDDDGDSDDSDDDVYNDGNDVDTWVKCQKSLLVWIPVSPDSSTTSVQSKHFTCNKEMGKICENETEMKECLVLCIFLVLSVIPFLLPSSHHVGSTSVWGASHRLDELLDDELYQVDPVLADLEAL